MKQTGWPCEKRWEQTREGGWVCVCDCGQRVAVKNQAKQEETKLWPSGGWGQSSKGSGSSVELEKLFEMPSYQKQETGGHLTHSTWRPASGFNKEIHVE